MRAVRGADERQLERRFGPAPVQRLLFAGMVAMFTPDAVPGFEGDLVYELTRPATGGTATTWTIEVRAGGAAVRRGGSEHAKLRMRFAVPDFVRIGTGELDPATPLLSGRATIKGDLSLATRLPEMFGARSPY